MRQLHKTCDTYDLMQTIDAPCDTNNPVYLGDANEKHDMIEDPLTTYEKESSNELISCEDESQVETQSDNINNEFEFEENINEGRRHLASTM